MHKCDKKIKTRTIHICLTDINCSGLRSFSSTFITVYRAHCSLVGTVQQLQLPVWSRIIKFQSLIGTVQHFFRIRYYKFSYICTLMFQSLIGTVQHNGKWAWYFLGSSRWVSISHRYGSTTVFTAFHVFIIPYFYRFSIFFSKKVGQPLHNKFPQSLDSTGFFIFVKISSEVHRLFGRFLLFSALFHAVFVLEALILLAWRFTDFFLQIF